MAVLIALIVASSMQEGLVEGLRHVWSRRWGLTTLADLYVGLVFVGIWIRMIERRASVTAAWCVGLVLTGNLATMAYLLARSLRSGTVREAILGSPTGGLA